MTQPYAPEPDDSEPHPPGHPDPHPDPRDPDARRLGAVLHTAFFLLLGGALARFLLRHPGEPRTPWVIALSLTLAALHVLGPVLGDGRPRHPRPSRRRLGLLGRLAAVLAVWMVLVVLAPSFAWCAVPLFYTGLRTLPARAALVLVAVLTVFVVAAQLRLAAGFDPNLLLAPPAVAALATAVFLHSERQAARQRALIDDLVRTRRELAASERRAGTLAERQRLSMEIHDTLAQGLSSQRMLLQAADRVWRSDPGKARAHVRSAASVAEHNLTEARRFVHDLAPADLAGGGSLPAALRALAERESDETLTVRVHVDGPTDALPDRVRSALLRIAQGALANVREHADATGAALTLTVLDDEARLDVGDDGRGFPPAAPPPGGTRGHGLPAMRARLRRLGGTLTVESAPGEGTVVTAAVPLAPPAPLDTPENP
ncbi:sensor histidine kinase [Streptomyces griseoviridis]|uniref:Oxygen sensor histidine kinase NreB n=1 Tax=Streptomyces griseoviridis TaxID=45398 RepID=A0A918LBY2_STRGD|nr:sensor histidine kinase [Streptomyces niveoruber]GGS28430.1 two-component sensor histidine kinase [Streptomyces niveoruber]